MRNGEKLLELERLNGDNKKLDDLVYIAEVVRIGAPTCDVNSHLNYVTATGINVWNGDPGHVIDVISNCTKPNIKDQWNLARQLEDVMVAEIFCASVCACCGRRCPHIDMQIGLKDTTDPNILEILISRETEKIKRPSRIRLSTSSNDYAIHDSYIGKSVFDICNLCHNSLSNIEPKPLTFSFLLRPLNTTIYFTFYSLPLSTCPSSSSIRTSATVFIFSISPAANAHA
jgi:hypothetical protein